MIVKNPIVNDHARSADPFVTYYNGRYYSCYTDGKNVCVSGCDRLDQLSQAEERIVWEGKDPTDEPWYAPELHRYNNKWYIYGAPGTAPDHTIHTMSVLESVDNDPMGPYIFRGKMKGLENVWSIDGTILEYGGKRYMVWSNSNLLIAEMLDPLTVSDKHILLTGPEEDWETVMTPIAEGPCIYKNGGKIHIIYSASDSKCDDYCLGMLTFTGGDILNPDDWKKSDGPVFRKTEKIFGPGHCSITQVHNGDKVRDVLVYHANLESGSGWYGRSIWLKPFDCEGGFPVFGKPEELVEL